MGPHNREHNFSFLVKFLKQTPPPLINESPNLLQKFINQKRNLKEEEKLSNEAT